MDLNWGNKNNENLEFPPKYWTYNINDYSQFSQGDHSVTKAFEHYLGLTDDYDFCMGPEEENQPLEGDEYTQRLWGVYAQTAGEIYLLKSRQDYIGWEEERRLTFAPSGSRHPTIVFDDDGYYILALQFVPAGEEIPEIWLRTYPYDSDNFRKISNGTEPQLFRGFGGEIYLFYTSVDQFRIHYRLMSEDFETEYTVEEILVERKLHLKGVFQVFYPFDSTGRESTENYYGHYMVVYEREDDYQPLKYLISEVIKTFPVSLEEEKLNAEQIGLLTMQISNIEWLETLAGEIEASENMNFNMQVSNITWQEIKSHEIDSVESFGLNVSLVNIEWQEIITQEHTPDTENFGLSISIENILWVEE